MDRQETSPCVSTRHQLQRPKASISQGEMPSARARLKNVHVLSQYQCAKRESPRAILLVDDVLTTGATSMRVQKH